VWALGGIKKRVFSFLIPSERKRETLLENFPLIIVIYLSHLFENSDFAQSYPIFAGLGSAFSFKVCAPFYLVTCAFVTKRKLCS